MGTGGGDGLAPNLLVQRDMTARSALVLALAALAVLALPGAARAHGPAAAELRDLPAPAGERARGTCSPCPCAQAAQVRTTSPDLRDPEATGPGRRPVPVAGVRAGADLPLDPFVRPPHRVRRRGAAPSAVSPDLRPLSAAVGR